MGSHWSAAGGRGISGGRGKAGGDESRGSECDHRLLPDNITSCLNRGREGAMEGGREGEGRGEGGK